MENAETKKESPELVDGHVPIYHVKMDKEMFGLTDDERARMQDLAQEYALCANTKVSAGLIVYGKYDGVWRRTWSTRFIIRYLLTALNAENAKTGNKTKNNFIQWKGTDICMDFYCDCGFHNHYDGQFAYFVQCGGCKQIYKMAESIEMEKVDSAISPMQTIEI